MHQRRAYRSFVSYIDRSREYYAAQGYSQPYTWACHDDAPFSPLKKPLSECKLALLTTGGLHLKTDPPFDTKYLEGDCSYRILPGNVRPEDITITVLLLISIAIALLMHSRTALQ